MEVSALGGEYCYDLFFGLTLFFFIYYLMTLLGLPDSDLAALYVTATFLIVLTTYGLLLD